MTDRLRLRTMLVTAGLHFTLSLTPIHAAEPIQIHVLRDDVNEMRAATEEWLRRAKAKGTYEYRETVAASLSDALAGKYDRSATPTATGMIAKLDDLFRLQLDYGKPPEKLSEGMYRNMSFDTVASNDMLVTHELKYGNFGGSIMIAPTRDQAGPRPSIDAMRTICHPFNAGGTLSGNPVADKLDAFGERAIKSVTRSGDFADIRFEVSIRGYREVHELRFWTEPDPPVLVRTSFSRRGNGSYFDEVTEASDFVDVNGIKIARLLRRCICSDWGAEPKPGAQWNVTEWRSDDLGDRRVTEGDFLMKVGRNQQVIGLSSAAMARGFPDGRVDIRKLSRSDVPATVQMAPRRRQDYPTRSIYRRLLPIAVVLVAAACVGYGVFRVVTRNR